MPRSIWLLSCRNLMVVLISLRMLSAGAAAGGAGAAAAPDAHAAVAVVFSRTIEGSSSGNGIFIGDGTLVVTAGHIVFPGRSSGLHRGEAMVTVLSPYRGDVAEMLVIARDDESDLVLLRGPWRGHPALQPAAEQAILAAETVDLIGFSELQTALLDPAGRRLASPPRIDQAVLEVNGVMVRQSASRSLLTRTAPPGSGWAGAPLLINGTNQLAGCFSRTQADGSAGSAVAAGRIRWIVEQANDRSAPERGAEPLPALPGAAEATVAYLRGVAASAGRDATAALSYSEQFLRFRPENAIGHRDAAGQLCALNRLDEAQLAFERALEIDPSHVSSRVLFGQFLSDRLLPQVAETQLRSAAAHATGGNAAAIPLCNLLTRQGRHSECLPVLDAAIERNPLDGHLWNYLGQARAAAGRHADAAAAFVRAAELMPDQEIVRAQAAQSFDAAGNRARADEQFRLLVAQHPRSAAAHYNFARFMSRDQGRREEALEKARLALQLSDRPGSPPRAAIQALIVAIRSGRAAQGDGFHL